MRHIFAQRFTHSIHVAQGEENFVISGPNIYCIKYAHRKLGPLRDLSVCIHLSNLNVSFPLPSGYLKMKMIFMLTANLSRRQLFLSIVCFCILFQLLGRPAAWSLSEHLDVIPSVEGWVLRRALAQEKMWADSLLSIDLSFNLPLNLSSGSMCPVYQRLLKVGRIKGIFTQRRKLVGIC